MAAPTRYRTAWISDLHLGTRGCNAEAVLRFLREVDCETLYLVGDLIDVWSLRRSRYWPQSHNDVIQKALRKGRKGTRLVYIPGNHDELLRGFFGEYGNLTIARRALHVTADGRRVLIIHGDELDTVIQNVKWLAYVGDVGYQFLLKLNRPVNFLRQLCGWGHWSLSAYVKARVKNAVAFIGEFENAVVRLASRDTADGVLCGHIHSAAVHETPGTVSYYNCGDFVESCTALVEDFDGRITLLTGFQHPADAEAAPTGGDEDESAEELLLPFFQERDGPLQESRPRIDYPQ